MNSSHSRNLSVIVILYGQQRFQRQHLGIFRTIRRLKRKFSRVQISGHLWQNEANLDKLDDFSPEMQDLLSQVEVSQPKLIEYFPPLGQDTNLVWQATSQRRAIQVALQSAKSESDVVIFTRTDLFIPFAEYLLHSIPKNDEVLNSNFHHDGFDDNIAILSWAGLQKLLEVDFRRALESPTVLHGEHLREQLLSQSNLRISQSIKPYVILRSGSSPHLDFTLAMIRLLLRRAFPGSIYKFATSPKSEFVRLKTKASQKMRSMRFEDRH